MNNQRRFGIGSLLFVTALAAILCAWWRDRQQLNARIVEAEQKSLRIVQENTRLRQSMRSTQLSRDQLYAQTIAQQDAINEFKQLAETALHVKKPAQE